MVKTRKILVVTLLATMLGAGRFISTAPAQNVPAVAQFTGRLIARLSGTVLRVVPAGQLYQTRRVSAARIVPQNSIAQTLAVGHVQLCLFHFRMPPPIV